MLVTTDADARIDRRGCSYRPTRMHVTTDADARIDRRGWYTPTISDDSISDIEDNYESEGGCKGIIYLGLHRTDGTDAFDTLYIGCEKFPLHDLYPIAIGGVR